MSQRQTMMTSNKKEGEGACKEGGSKAGLRECSDGGGILRAWLGYTEDDGERPYAFAYDRTEKEIAQSSHPKKAHVPRVDIEVDMLNGRLVDAGFNLDETSFTFVSHTTKLTRKDFYVEEIVKEHYYSEMEELLIRETGCEKVLVMHHAVRNVALQGKDPKVQGYALSVHSDANYESANGIFQKIAPFLPSDRFHKGRFLYVNVWRSIGDKPVLDHHLAVCDQRSIVAPDDFLVGDYFAETGRIPQHHLQPTNARRHKWYFFPSMERDEAIIFKQWDSDPTLQGRICMHSAFSDPTAPTDAPPRESIEVRCVCFFPDHTPNTCPPVRNPDDASSSGDDGDLWLPLNKIRAAVRMLPSWPKQAITWIQISLLRGEEGVKEVAQAIVNDKDGHLGFSKLSQETKAALLRKLTSDGEFEALLRKHVPDIPSLKTK